MDLLGSQSRHIRDSCSVKFFQLFISLSQRELSLMQLVGVWSFVLEGSQLFS